MSRIAERTAAGALMLWTMVGVASSLAGSGHYEYGFRGATRDYGKSLEVNDPISAANGAYYSELPLFSLGGPMDLECRLYYRSDLSRYGQELPEAFWWSPYARASSEVGHGTSVYATVYLPDSRQVSFRRNSESNWVPTGPTAEVDGGEYIYTDNTPRATYQLQESTNWLYLTDAAAGQLLVFENYLTYSNWPREWRVRWIMDRCTNLLTFTYAWEGVSRPAAVSDGLGRSLAFNYLISLTNIVDFGGRSVSFHYDFAGADNGGSETLRAITNAAGQGVRFAYGGSVDGFVHLMAAVKRPAGNTPYVQAYAARTLYGGSFPRVVTQWDAFSNRYDMAYTASNNVVTAAAPDGTTNRFRHSSSHGFPVTRTDAAGGTISFDQDEFGRLTSVHDRLGGKTVFAYDPASGLPAVATNVNGDVLRFTWTPREQTFINPSNGEAVAATFYDLTRVDYPDGTFETFDYDGCGNATLRVDRAGAVWQYSYNQRGQMIAVTNPVGGWVRYTYHSDGTLATVEDADGVITTYGYDALKRLNRITHSDGSFAAWGYDVLDQITAYTNELGAVTRYEYDANGNITRVTDPLGQAENFQYDAMDRLTMASNRSGGTLRFAYDAAGRLAAVTNPVGVATRLGYDPNSRLTSIAVGGSIWTFGRDAEGLVVSMTDPLGNVAGVERDALGNVTRITNAVGHETTLARDAVQRITARSDLLGRTRNYSYDSVGRLIAVSVPVGSSPQASSNRYDAAGRLVAVVDLNTQEWNFAYTAAGRLQALTDPLTNTWQVVYDGNGRLAGGTRPDGTVWTNRFDAAGRVTNRAWVGGPSLAFGYDANGRLVSAEQLALAYNPDGLVTASVQAGVACAYAYDAAGRLTSITYPGAGFSVTYAYDPTNGLLTSVSDTLTSTAIEFEYDAAFRPVGITRPNGVDTVYSWDAAGQLTRIQDGTVLDLRYAYDSAGQVTQLVAGTPLAASALLVSGVVTQAVDAASQLAGAPYGYDANGRLTNMPGLALGWDAAGRLVQAGELALAHDGLGRPVRQVVGGQTNGLYSSFANGLDGLLAERDENTGQWTRFYVWTPAGQLLYLIEAAAGNQVRHYHFDRGGNVLALTDAAGNVTDAYAYSPFGRLLGRTGASDQPFLFMGRFGVRREGTGALYHVRTRYYDAETGRFLTREPLWPQIARPEMLNPYSYAANAPVDQADSTGLEPAEITAAQFQEQYRQQLASMSWEQLQKEAEDVEDELKTFIEEEEEEKGVYVELTFFINLLQGNEEAIAWVKLRREKLRRILFKQRAVEAQMILLRPMQERPAHPYPACEHLLSGHVGPREAAAKAVSRITGTPGQPSSRPQISRSSASLPVTAPKPPWVKLPDGRILLFGPGNENEDVLNDLFVINENRWTP